ncbi:helix-turn-helix domain-containing protein, partial [Escherichia coli]|uniref:helix-turn-helix domain-containing protein n=1 Tax=Escherichia coli TaxID=562 RepID=UPI003CFE7AE5
KAKFSKAIIDYRAEYSFSKKKNTGLRELGKMLGVSAPTLSRIIRGNKADIDSILLICTAINKKVTDFIK